jgi:hypothetical protein
MIDPTAREEFLRLLAGGQTRHAAAEQAGLDPEVLRWVDILNPDLEEAMRKAEAEAEGKVALALFEAATSGNVPAAKAYLDMKAKRR